jgi:hypothetical protein
VTYPEPDIIPATAGLWRSLPGSLYGGIWVVKVIVNRVDSYPISLEGRVGASFSNWSSMLASKRDDVSTSRHGERRRPELAIALLSLHMG